MDSPCHHCEKRIVGCHSTCELYKEFRSACNAVMEKRKEENMMKDIQYLRDKRITAHTGRSNK